MHRLSFRRGDSISGVSMIFGAILYAAASIVARSILGTSFTMSCGVAGMIVRLRLRDSLKRSKAYQQIYNRQYHNRRNHGKDVAKLPAMI